MKKIFILLHVSIFLLFAQEENRSPKISNDIPEFYVNTLSFSSGDSTSTRVDLYVQVPYDALKFVISGERYVAKYEVTVNFLTGENASASEKVWTEVVNLDRFELTQSRDAHSLTERSIDIAPGLYTVRAQFVDFESRKKAVLIKKTVVGNYAAGRLAISDLLLISKVSSEGEKKSIVPNISENIGENNNAFSVFYELYTPETKDSIRLHYMITDVNGNLLLGNVQPYVSHSTRNQIIARFDSTKFSAGRYRLIVEAQSLFDNDTGTVVKQKDFFVSWGNMPVTITDLDLAIKELKYIAHADEISAFDKAKTEEEKRWLFEEFWKKRDPNPDTKRNEYMEGYYNRVQYANEHFSHYIDGWRSDRGMVYIMFGPPNNVDRHPFDIDAKPYEIWSYYDFNKQIVFMDESGFGDYRLLTPIYDLMQMMHY